MRDHGNAARKEKRTGTIVGIVAAAYGLLFVAAVLGKLDGWRGWSRAIHEFLPNHRRLARAARAAVPALEGAVAVLAFARPNLGLLAAGALLAVFAVVVAALQSRHAGAECNCFGAVASSRIGRSLIARNAALSAVAFGVAIISSSVEVARLSASEYLALVLAASLLFVSTEFRTFFLSTQRGRQ